MLSRYRHYWRLANTDSSRLTPEEVTQSMWFLLLHFIAAVPFVALAGWIWGAMHR